MKSLISDFISFFFGVMPAAMSWMFVIYLFKLVSFNLLFIPLVPIILILTLSFIVFFVRLLLPTIKKGVYDVGVNVPYISWVIHLALLRSLYFSGLRPLVNCFFSLKYIFYRALGARISITLGTAISSEFVDLPLITIGKNCFFGDGVKVSCHVLLKGKLILRPVVIGDNCVVANHAEIRPGSTLGDGEVFPPKESKS